MKHLFWLLIAISPISALAQSSAERPTGQPMSIAIFMIMGVVLFAVFRILDYIKGKESPPPPPPPPPVRGPMPTAAAPAPRAKSLDQQITETFGDLKEVGKNTYFTGGIIGKGGDTERYIAMAKINKGYIRDEERAKANANYELYRDRIKYLRIAVALLAALSLIFSLEFIVIIYRFIKGWLA